MTRAGSCLAAGLFVALSLAWPPASAAATAPAEASGDADEPRSPARDTDPETLARRLSRAVERDAADAVLHVLQLLDSVDVENLAFEPLHQAARDGSPRVAEALLHAGFDANAKATYPYWDDNAATTPLIVAATYESMEVAALLIEHGARVHARDGDGSTPLHQAARHESSEVAALLIEHGAQVDARNDDGWTPLHVALELGSLPHHPSEHRTAKLLLEHGADVDAATEAMGWTPLHLAAHLSGSDVWQDSDEPGGWNAQRLGSGADVLEIVVTLIERGADVNARARIGGWTPARVAKKSDGRRRQEVRLDPDAWSLGVLAALRAAGGRDEGCDHVPGVPVRYAASGFPWRERERRHADVAPGCAYDVPLDVAGAIGSGGWEVAGSFTAPGADERLLFTGAGMLGTWGPYKLASLQDRHGVVRPIIAFDTYTKYRGLCFDRETATHTALFTFHHDGNCCEGMEDTAYFHYDADAGTAVAVFMEGGWEDPPTGEDAACLWRDKLARLDAYEDALNALRVGRSPGLAYDGEPFPLHSRAVSEEVAQLHLAALRELPGFARVRSVESPRWQVVAAEYRRGWWSYFSKHGVCAGALLVRDVELQEWRSIYDCAYLADMEIHGDTLAVALSPRTSQCRSCYLEVDLTTLEARRWDESHGADRWRDRRKRPQ